MANELLFSGLGDLRVTEVLSRAFILSLADRAALQNHPALIYAGDAGETGSTTIKVGEIGWMGADQLATVAEGASVTNTALTDASHTVTVSRRAKAYAPSDLARLTDSLGHLSPQMFAQDAVMSAAMELTNDIANLVDNFATTVGTSGNNLTTANWYAATANLMINNVEGPYLCVLHSRQYADFIDALRAETGTLHVIPPTQEQTQRLGRGFQGQFQGVDIFVSNQVPTANSGADRAGGMFGRGAILWADGTFAPDPAVVGMNLGKVRLEFDRDGAAAVTQVITNYMLGSAEGIDLAGVSIITDA